MAMEGNSFDSTQRQIRDSNLASSRITQQHVSQLKLAGGPNASQGNPEIVVVPIPDVSKPRTTESRKALDHAPEIVSVPFERTAVKADLSTSGSDSQHTPQRPIAAVSPAPTSPPVVQAPIANPSAKSSSNQAEIGDPSTSKPPETAQDNDAWWYSLSQLGNDRPILEITRRILAQFPSIAPSTLMFASADPVLSTNRATARIAAALAQQTGCRVLLVDANWEMNISPLKQSGDAVLGITEVLADNLSWKELVIETQEKLLHVLPCGITDVPMRRIGPETLLALNSQLQRDYMYVCVNAGSAKQLIARRFASVCDGTYLLVGLNQTTKKDAQSTIKLLSESHARVLGAIVFDSPMQA
jgi:hypothetical protein